METASATFRRSAALLASTGGRMDACRMLKSPKSMQKPIVPTNRNLTKRSISTARSPKRRAKARMGCLVECVRRVAGWSGSSCEAARLDLAVDVQHET